MRPRLAAVLVLLTLLPACGVSGLDFRRDDRLEIVAPKDRAAVRLPLVVRWTVEDFRVTGRDGSRSGDAGYFGVYVDRAPQPPGHTQEWLVRDDPACRPPCPDEAFLAQRDVYSTTQTSFRIDRLPQPSTNAPRRRELHEITVVLLDGSGARIGESGVSVEFEVRR